MTLTLSHGPWSVTIARPTDSRPAFQAHYALNERAQVDTTYQWDWKGQSLNGVRNCSFSFASLKVRSPITWNPSVAQGAWYNTKRAGGTQALTEQHHPSEGEGDQGYVQIELNAQYRWERELTMGQAGENWHAGA